MLVITLLIVIHLLETTYLYNIYYFAYMFCNIFQIVMPLSEFKPSWSVAVHEQPLFYSFTGTKRKISWNSQQQTMDNQQVMV